VGVAVGGIVGVVDGFGDDVGLGFGVGEGVGVTVGVGEGVGVEDGFGDELGLGEGDGEGEGDGLGVGEGEGFGEVVGLIVGVACSSLIELVGASLTSFKFGLVWVIATAKNNKVKAKATVKKWTFKLQVFSLTFLFLQPTKNKLKMVLLV
jgi:hypothetical protein